MDATKPAFTIDDVRATETYSDARRIFDAIRYHDATATKEVRDEARFKAISLRDRELSALSDRLLISDVGEYWSTIRDRFSSYGDRGWFGANREPIEFDDLYLAVGSDRVRRELIEGLILCTTEELD